MRLFKRGGSPELIEGVSGESADDTVEAVRAVDSADKPSPKKMLAFRIMPTIALLLALIIGLLKWLAAAGSGGEAAAEAVRAATDGTVAILSYQPGTIEKDLDNAEKLLTGTFRDEYTKLANDTVIPGAKQRQVSTLATVPAVAAVSASAFRAEVLVFVDQTVIVGNGAPNNTSSSVRVKLNKVGDRWLISAFDPI